MSRKKREARPKKRQDGKLSLARKGAKVPARKNRYTVAKQKKIGLYAAKHGPSAAERKFKCSGPTAMKYAKLFRKYKPATRKVATKRKAAVAPTRKRTTAKRRAATPAKVSKIDAKLAAKAQAARERKRERDRARRAKLKAQRAVETTAPVMVEPTEPAVA